MLHFKRFYMFFKKTLNIYTVIICFLYLFASQQLIAKTYQRIVPLDTNKINLIKRQGTSLISSRLGTYILRASSLEKSKKYQQAIDLLNYHYNKPSINKTEKAKLAVQLAYLYQQNKNSKKSISLLKKSLNLQALPYAQYLSALYALAQMRAEQGKFNASLKLLKNWFSLQAQPHPEAYALLAYCYYEKNQLSASLMHIEKTLSLVTKPKENWLQFVVAIYLKQKNYKKAQPYLERLVALYPAHASNWKQLAAVYLHLKKNKHAFITLDMANKMQHLKTKTDYLNLSTLYVDQNMPYQGALFLKDALLQNLIPKNQKHFEILATAFWMAREEGLALFYLKKASLTARKPGFFIQYGQKLLDQEQWAEAKNIFQKALKTPSVQASIIAVKSYKKKLANLDKNKSKQRSTFYNTQTSAKLASMASAESLTHDLTQKIKIQKTDTNKSKQALITPPQANALKQAYFGIGVALYQLGDYPQALIFFKKTINVDDSFINAYQWIDYTETSLLEAKKKKQQKAKI